MKMRRKRTSALAEKRFLNAVYGRGVRRGSGEITLKRILKHDPETIIRCSRPILSLDYTLTDAQGVESAPFGEQIDPSSIVFPKRKTLIDQVNEKDVLELTKRVRLEILATWRQVYSSGRAGAGTYLAVKVFDGLCGEDTPVEIARSLNVSRQRVLQVQKQLKRLPAIIKMGRELRMMKSDH